MVSKLPTTPALAIPEIVSLIGEFIPLWSHHFYFDYKFEPAALLRLSRVCKTWHQSLLPIIWRVYCHDSMHDVPEDVLARNSFFFRTLYYRIQPASPSWTEVASFNQVKRISFAGNNEIIYELMKRIGTVTHLEWHSVFKDLPETTQVLQSISPTLTHLRLANWTTLKYQQLLDMLCCLPRLQSLSLTTTPKDISNLSEGPFAITSLPIKELEWIQEQELIPSTDSLFFDHFIQCCPFLEQFALVAPMPDSERMPPIFHDQSLTKAVAWARRFCPHLRTLVVRSPLDKDAKYSATIAVADPHHNGLLALDASIRSVDESLLSMLMLETTSLQSLRLECLEYKKASREAELLLQAVLSPDFAALRFLHFKSHYRFTEEQKSLLFDTEWRCLNLEALTLDGHWSSDAYESPIEQEDMSDGAKSRWRAKTQRRSRNRKRIGGCGHHGHGPSGGLPELTTLSLGGV
ncbi:hypothetical protein EMPS_06904 [Entomortierella parvispora]|uniref:F-box domain-containing protein n=1 Tax=Entomortierella parvispora TaxID=205924 RepID=A0A9P3LXN5_9FUNG|nr:hypothetical protein EMPS_06904 [Entomortierella parvispora]